MGQIKLNVRNIEALEPPSSGQSLHWDTEIRGFGILVGAGGTKSFVIQYDNRERRRRRLKIGRFGIITVEEARELARIKLGEVAAGIDPAEVLQAARREQKVSALCDWYLEEARAGRILGRRNRPIKASTLDGDEGRINVHIKPLIGNRVAKHLTIADVEKMQNDILIGETAKPRKGGRGNNAKGGAGVASRCVSTLQSILGHAHHLSLLDVHPTRGARKLAGNKRKRRLSSAEIILLGKAMAVAERNGESPIGLAIVRTLLLTGFRKEEGQAMEREWVDAQRGYVAFPDTKGDAQIRAVGPEAIKVIMSQPRIAASSYVFPSLLSDGPTTVAYECLKRLCKMADIKDVSPHILRHTFGSVAGDLGFSELTIKACLGHASQSVTQDYVHVDDALKLAVHRTSDEIARLLQLGAEQAGASVQGEDAAGLPVGSQGQSGMDSKIEPEGQVQQSPSYLDLVGVAD